MYVYALSFRGFETSSQQSLQALEMVYLHIWETGKCRPTSCNVHCLYYWEQWNLWNLTAQSGRIAIIYCHLFAWFCMLEMYGVELHARVHPKGGRHLRWKDLHPEEPAAKAAGSDVRSCHEHPWAANQFSGLVFVCKMHTNAYKGLQNHIRNCWRELPVKTRPEQRGLFNGDTHKPSWKPKQHGPLRQTALVLATWWRQVTRMNQMGSEL